MSSSYSVSHTHPNLHQRSAFAKSRFIKSVGSIFILALLVAGLTLPVLAADSEKATTQSQKAKASSSEEYILSLDDIRDVGLSLLQIRHQAIFIYMEATRTQLPTNASCRIVEPSVIPVHHAGSREKYLPCRHDWLVFFIGSMEPVIRMMAHDVKDFQSGTYKLEIPHADKELFNKLWQEWEDGVAQLNKSLDKTYDLLNNDITDNQAIADQAVAIFNTTEKLEDIRLKAHYMVQASLKK